MKTWARALLFIAAFQMEVRVRASAELIERPESCVKAQGVCTVQSPTGPFVYSDKAFTLRASAQSTVERVEGSHWKLLSGAVWIAKGAHVRLETLFAEVRSESGEFWVVEKEKRIVIRNLSANLKVFLRDGQELPLPAGFEFWVGGINTQARSEFGILQAIDLKDHIRNWAALYPGSTADFKKDVKEFKETWKVIGAQGGDIYQGFVDRKLASVAEAAHQEKLKKARAEAETRRVRDLYFEKVFSR